MLAIADFVPGDVDKDQMIADYVNDQIDVVGRAFLGLTLACARCHDHKFDPISTEDYYALAGIFFSTRLIPGPVPGNTPLVRVPLLSPDELAKIQAQDAADKRRRAELEQQLPDAADRAYRRLSDAARSPSRRRATSWRPANAGKLDRQAKPSLAELAKQHGLHERLAGRVGRLSRPGREAASTAGHPIVRDAAAGKLAGADARDGRPTELQDDLAALAARRGRGRPFARRSTPWPVPA